MNDIDKLADRLESMAFNMMQRHELVSPYAQGMKEAATTLREQQRIADNLRVDMREAGKVIDEQQQRIAELEAEDKSNCDDIADLNKLVLFHHQRIAALENVITSLMTEEQLDASPPCLDGTTVRSLLK